MSSLQFTPHPILEAPTDDEILLLSETPEGRNDLIEWHKAYHAALRAAEEDPVYNGFKLPQQEMVEELLRTHTECWVFGGNRSGKSFNSARMVMRALMENPGTTIICWAQNEEASIEMQQPYLYQMLPANLRGKVKEQVANINWNDKSGFTGKKFVLPNGSKCLFRFYSQFIANPKMIEGYRLGAEERKCGYINIGTWLDEYYLDESLIKKLYRRCNDNNAKILTSFTPLDGYTPTVAKQLKGATIEKTLYASMLKREMPYVMQPTKKESSVVFFHTEKNPFTNFDRLKADLHGCPEEEVMTIAYGYPTSSITTNFPLFNTDVHVVSERPTFDRKKHTCYQIIDPADARNFFSIWALVDANGDINIIREWPDRDTYGEWALLGSGGQEGGKWKHGPGSKKIGYAIRTDNEDYSYPCLFMEIEKELGVTVFERIGDCRFMARENDMHDMFSDFAEKDIDVVPSDGRDEKSGLQLVDQWFIYNPNVEVDSSNCPKLRIHKSCGNLIDSIINYSPTGGKAYEALKDPIDCLRYLRTANGGDGPEHYDENSFKQEEPTWGY